ncbi:MAG: sensor histidine kinase [Acidimicrobiales bacterium]
MARMVGPEWPVELEADGAGEEVGPVVVEADGLRIRQVLDNLLANVRVHTPPGTHATVRVARDGDDAVIEVADDGPGLSAADARRIFERFFRADPSRSRAHGGAGLGLAIVQSIVHAHGGTVTLGAAPSAGARFVVRLPEHSRPQAMGAVAAAPDALAGTDDRAAGIEEGTAVTARTDAEVSTGEAPTADDGADAADAATAGDGKAAGNGVPSSRRSWGFPHRRP